MSFPERQSELVDTDATDLESAFVDTIEQALDHLTTWH
jgi:hypothetical protein